MLLGDVDGDGEIEVVVGSSGNETGENPIGLLGVFDARGQLEFCHPSFEIGSTGAIGDFDNDGYTDLFVYGWPEDGVERGYMLQAIKNDIRPIYNSNTLIWPFRYNTLTNNAVIPIAEVSDITIALLTSFCSITFVRIGLRFRRVTWVGVSSCVSFPEPNPSTHAG
jgi:hypothetical protein